MIDPRSRLCDEIEAAIEAAHPRTTWADVADLFFTLAALVALVRFF